MEHYDVYTMKFPTNLGHYIIFQVFDTTLDAPLTLFEGANGAILMIDGCMSDGTADTWYYSLTNAIGGQPPFVFLRNNGTRGLNLQEGKCNTAAFTLFSESTKSSTLEMLKAPFVFLGRRLMKNDTLDLAGRPLSKETIVLPDPDPDHASNLLKHLLLSGDQSDISFVCNDGVKIPAHKNILAASSVYFSKALSGSWNEKDFHPEADSKVMKCLLTFLYTGQIDWDSGVQPVELIPVAHLYGLNTLVQTCEAHCLQSLTVENLAIYSQTSLSDRLSELEPKRGTLGKGQGCGRSGRQALIINGTVCLFHMSSLLVHIQY